MEIESFLNCLGRLIEITKISDLEWRFKLRDAVMLQGNLRVNPGIVTLVELKFFEPNGNGKIEITKGSIIGVSYSGILELKLRPRITECSKILAGNQITR
ncbi:MULTISPECIES: hypothetical protein [Metallosphaera]|uniref:Uncharacterized protein n=1 Tax=Metallosphaera cuprina (strain Ar-4) TaxID=1006006 RepID=F4G285_METCR|nr:hypothetical protein [Metallosphaera cuprina]AEB94933.1 conserved hypothetical protein [Metallosphaera cuprina Ar-4]